MYFSNMGRSSWAIWVLLSMRVFVHHMIDYIDMKDQSQEKNFALHNFAGARGLFIDRAWASSPKEPFEEAKPAILGIWAKLPSRNPGERKTGLNREWTRMDPKAGMKIPAFGVRDGRSASRRGSERGTSDLARSASPGGVLLGGRGGGGFLRGARGLRGRGGLRGGGGTNRAGSWGGRGGCRSHEGAVGQAIFEIE
jgi:hypothetical protein